MRRPLISLVLAAMACGDNRHPAEVIMDVGPDAPSYGRAPFPTDALRDGVRLELVTGLDAMAKGHSDLLAAHLASLDGWGLRPTIEFFVVGPLDPASVPAHTTATTDAAFVVDVDPNSPELGNPIAMDWKYEPDRNVLAGSPSAGAMLREGTRYAAVITTDIHGVDGDALYSGLGLGQLGHDPPERWKSTAAAYAGLAADPVLGHRIAGISVFTTQAASDGLVKARNLMANAALVAVPTLVFDDPAIIFDTPARLDALLGQATRDTTGPRAGLEQWGTDNPTGIAHDHVAVVATGKTTIARFRGDDTGTEGPESKTFHLGPGGVPQLLSIDTIPVTYVLPKAAMPAAGFPVVIFGHGLGGSRHDMFNLVEPLTSQGYAVVAIDMFGHGSRYDPGDDHNNFASKPAFTGDPNLRDGFGDTTGTITQLAFFESFMNVSAIRDSIRQSVLDFSRLATLVQRAPDLSALSAPYGATPKLDVTKVAYLGESFGTIVGSSVAAIEPSVGLFVLDVPGGGLLDQILPGSASIATLALPYVEEIYRTSGTLDRFHPLIGIMQAVFDAGDPLTFARHVLTNRFHIGSGVVGKRSVVCIEVVGDEIMANAGTTALAHAFGLAVLKPDLVPPPGLVELASPASGNVDGQTAILVQYEPATHGYNWSAQHGNLDYVPGFPFPGDDPFPKLPASITISEPIYETQAQVAEILATYFTNLPPVVRSTKPPVADFDGDGDVDP